MLYRGLLPVADHALGGFATSGRRLGCGAGTDGGRDGDKGDQDEYYTFHFVVFNVNDVAGTGA
jgi:hypothetical protein